MFTTVYGTFLLTRAWLSLSLEHMGGDKEGDPGVDGGPLVIRSGTPEPSV